MPDIKTALSKVITEWEKPAVEPAPATKPAGAPDAVQKPWHFKPTNNITRATFNHIKQNPGLARTNVTKQLEAKGYKYTSTSTLITQMMRNGMVKLVDGGLFVTQDEYTPLKPHRPAKAARVARTPRKERNTATPVEAQAPIIKQGRSVRDLLEGLSVLQARELYDELRKIFGFNN